MNNEKKITVFTPTYNRRDTLGRAYESLLNQTDKNFKWLIIDDGSTDDTEDIVKKWISDNKIEIEYHKKENGGKHSAYNYACKFCTTELTLLCLDSDDYLTENAIELILKEYYFCKESIFGVVALCNDENFSGKFCKKYDIDKLKYISVSDALKNNHFQAGAIFAIKSDYMKKFLYPIINGEKFFTEAYLLYQWHEPFLWLNDSLCIREFREDGLTKNTPKLFLKYPNSWFLYNKLRMKENRSFKLKIKYTIYYVTFGVLSKRKKIIFESPYKFMTLLLYPIGLLGVLLLKIKR